MRTAVADTSVDAFHALGSKADSQQARIVAHLMSHPRADFTRSELAEALGMRLSSVCGRCNELVTAGTIQEGPRRACSLTGVAAHTLRITPAQGVLFS